MNNNGNAINKKLRSSDILVPCPDCGAKRWVRKARYEKPTFTGYCHQCTARRAARYISRRVDYPSGKQDLGNGNYILWDTLCSKNDGMDYDQVERNTNTGAFVKVFCRVCRDTRWCPASLIYKGAQAGTFTGYCQKHYREATKGPQHFAWKGGTFVNSNGYVIINQSALSPEDLELVRDMMPKKYPYIMEHRLVMARHLGRPLESHEVVHHRNGIRDDNHLENLQLRTKATHGDGHGDPYYQLWQEALSEIAYLKRKLESSQS